jgi:hypothetical protein
MPFFGTESDKGKKEGGSKEEYSLHVRNHERKN